jgi:hypothetical protein
MRNLQVSYMLHYVDLTVNFTFAICVQLWLMFTHLLFIKTYITCFILIGHPQVYELYAEENCCSTYLL